MTKRGSRLWILWILLLATAITSFPYAAATPMDHPNTYTNTGNMRADLIGVALTQVGYYEGANNDTKYGVWYGWNHLGWCGMFVSWCAEQAGIPKSIIPKTGSADPQYFNLTARSGREYRPQAGDLFFRKDSYGNYAHVGIVYYLDGDYFYTIEGNTYYAGPEGVYIRQRKIADFFFGAPNYADSSEHSYQAAYETAHPHKEYYKCSHCGDQYYSGKTTTRSDCAECVAANCSHSFGTWSSSGNSQHQRSCSKCGKKETGSHSWNNGSVTKEPTCNSTGEKQQTCTLCSAVKKTAIPALTSHNWGSWDYLNNTEHERRCLGCQKADKKSHTVPEDWNTDEAEHWKICADCEGEVSRSTHNFGDECDSPCQTCGFIRENGHQYPSDWETNSLQHWQSCQLCQELGITENHSYDHECDDTCDTCGYSRKVVHAFDSYLPGNMNGHKAQCVKCGLISELQDHEPGAEATEEHGQSCLLCGLQLSPALSHKHNFTVVNTNFLFHNTGCSCGAEIKNVLHSWDPENKRCNECGIDLFTALIPIVFISIILLSAAVGIIVLFVGCLKKRRYRM